MRCHGGPGRISPSTTGSNIMRFATISPQRAGSGAACSWRVSTFCARITCSIGTLRRAAAVAGTPSSAAR